LCVPVADVAGRRQLRSASRGLLNFPHYNMSNYGRRAFCFADIHTLNGVTEKNYVWIFMTSGEQTSYTSITVPEHIRQSTSPQLSSSAH